MANEITINATLEYDDGVSSPASSQVTDFLSSVTTPIKAQFTQSIPTSSTAINLAGIASPRWVMFINRDSVNYVEIKVASAGAIFAKLLPGEFCLLPLGSGAQVPYAIANTAAVDLDVLICSL